MLLYRVFPHVPDAAVDEPGHPLYIHTAGQGKGRWDNPHLYTAMYLATSPEAAIGETFGGLAQWTPKMLPLPSLNTIKALGVYNLDEETHPLLNLDNASALQHRNLRPTDVVIRNRPHTQDIAARIHAETRWSGIQWWSYQRPQWTVMVLWNRTSLIEVDVQDIASHPGLLAAASTLAKPTTGF